MVDDICRLTAAALSAKLRDGEITAEQLARACLARIAAREADVRAWSYVDPDAVIRQARELDKPPPRATRTILRVHPAARRVDRRRRSAIFTCRSRSVRRPAGR